MPYKKGGEAEQRARVRRTAKRRIARLEKEIERSDDAHEQQLFRAQISNIQDEISRTYERNPLTHKATGFSRDELRMATQNLKRANESSLIGTSSNARNDFITQQELNLAKSYDFIGPTQSRYTREEVSVFYAATKEAWENLPSTANRNEAILKYYKKKNPEKYGDMSLSEFVDYVLSINSRAVEIAQHAREYVEDSDELTPEEVEEAAAGSEIWSVGIVSVSQYDAASSYVKRAE
jgi:hypothetical protein